MEKNLKAWIVEPERVASETWPEREFAHLARVSWKLLFSADQTPTSELTMGLATIQPGGVLPLHHHEPAEIYYVLSGEGIVEIDGESHPLREGVAVFIPPDARHRTSASGNTPLHFVFVFPTASYADVTYHYHEEPNDALEAART